MARPPIDLGSGGALLDLRSFGRVARVTPTTKQAWTIAYTVRRAPEVMVKVSGGARTLGGVQAHFAYIGRDGELDVEVDHGFQFAGKGFEKQLVPDWDLDLLAHRRQDERSILGKRPSPKLVHNLIFSMPPGTPAKKVLAAVRKLAVNEFAFKHRYALVLHTDEAHPHVHLVVKAESEQGERLNIRKATLRQWRQQFAENLRELGISANATARAVRRRDPDAEERRHLPSGPAWRIDSPGAGVARSTRPFGGRRAAFCSWGAEARAHSSGGGDGMERYSTGP